MLVKLTSSKNMINKPSYYFQNFLLPFRGLLLCIQTMLLHHTSVLKSSYYIILSSKLLSLISPTHISRMAFITVIKCYNYSYCVRPLLILEINRRQKIVLLYPSAIILAPLIHYYHFFLPHTQIPYGLYYSYKR